MIYYSRSSFSKISMRVLDILCKRYNPPAANIINVTIVASNSIASSFNQLSVRIGRFLSKPLSPNKWLIQSLFYQKGTNNG